MLGKRTLFVGLASAIASLALIAVALGAPDATATVRFGLENVGSPFPPPAEHDRSTNAQDNLVPRTVVISQGGSVTFEIAPFHQVAIYEPGTTPNDIEISPATLEDLPVPFPPFVLPDFIINDPDSRVVLGPPLAFSHQTWTTPASTFDQPGRYLVICTVLPHFEDNNMYGWVIVK